MTLYLPLSPSKNDRTTTKERMLSKGEPVPEPIKRFRIDQIIPLKLKPKEMKRVIVTTRMGTGIPILSKVERRRR